MDSTEERTLARQALDSLTDKERAVLQLRADGLDYTAISNALNIARTSVGTTLAEARRVLSERYLKCKNQQESRAHVG